MANRWHKQDLNRIEEILKTDLSDGLSISEARLRLEYEKKQSKNKRKSLFIKGKKNALQCLLIYFTTPSVILLLIMSILTWLFGRTELGFSLLAVTLVGAIFGGILNLNACRRIESMADYAVPMVKVKRGGNIFRTDGRNVVRGDIIILAAGDLLPCDARLLTSDKLVVDEFYHNGKSVNIRRTDKRHDSDCSDENIVAPNASNMLYAGSAVVSGEAVAVVTEVSDKVYLSDYVSAGALSGKDTEAEGVEIIKPTFYKIMFIATSSLLLLSLLGLLTLQNVDFICIFTMLLSSVVLLTTELLKIGSAEIISSHIKLISRARNKNRDFSAAVRNVKAFDTLNSITDLVLIGRAGLTDGTSHINSVYTLSGETEQLSPDNSHDRRILTLINTYVKALRESGAETHLSLNGYADSISAYVKDSGFDVSGASLAIKSLYFANDGKYAFACAETANDSYKTALVFDKNIIKSCNSVFDKNGLREITKEDLTIISNVVSKIEGDGCECLYLISGGKDTIVLEAILSVSEHSSDTLQDTINYLSSMNVRATVFLPEDDDMTSNLIASEKLTSLFGKNIAYAKGFKKLGKNVLDNIGSYCAYVGFSLEEYAAIISKMRKTGLRVATYAVNNDYNEIMARADIAISCDVIRYSSEKHKASVYEKLPAEGRESNIRCSQQTRLLSKVLVKREKDNDCGLLSIGYAIKKAKGAYISISQSILLYVYLMCGLLTFSAMSVITGNMLLNPLQTLSLAVTFAFLSVVIFSKSEHKAKLYTQKINYTELPAVIIKNSLTKIIAKASVAAVTAITIKILDLCGVFGEEPSFTMPIYICLLLTVFFEVFIINRRFTVSGDGRSNSWLKVLVAYAILMSIGALSTHQPLINEFYPDGRIGSFEFLIIPAYALLYVCALPIANIIDKKRKKS